MSPRAKPEIYLYPKASRGQPLDRQGDRVGGQRESPSTAPDSSALRNRGSSSRSPASRPNGMMDHEKVCCNAAGLRRRSGSPSTAWVLPRCRSSLPPPTPSELRHRAPRSEEDPGEPSSAFVGLSRIAPFRGGTMSRAGFLHWLVRARCPTRNRNPTKHY